VTLIDGASGMRGRRCAERSRGGSEVIRLRGACAVSLVSSRPGGVGAPPGDTTIPRQELANVGRSGPSPDMMLALEWERSLPRQGS
jgi:hypothetical protein